MHRRRRHRVPRPLVHRLLPQRRHHGMDHHLPWVILDRDICGIHSVRDTRVSPHAVILLTSENSFREKGGVARAGTDPEQRPLLAPS
jgi:hypothetical protein